MGCGGSTQSALLLQEEPLKERNTAGSNESTVEPNDEAPPGDSLPWKEVVKVDSQRSARSQVTTGDCTPAEAIEAVPSETIDSLLSADFLQAGTGAPDMENSKLNANLRKFAVIDAEGTIPEEFPRLARLIIRNQARMVAGQELKVSRCFSEDTADYSLDLGKGSGVVGCRRLTEPVLADERFKHIEGSGHRTSQELQVKLWRSWQEKDPRLAGRLSDKEEPIQSSQSSPAIVKNALQVPDDLVAALDAQLDNFRIEEELELASIEKAAEESRGVAEEGISALVEGLQTAVQEVLYRSGDGNVPEALALDTTHNHGDAEWQRRENVLFMLDWDDTIFPTTWLATKPWFRNWIREKGSPESIGEIDPEDLEHLNALDMAAHEFISWMNSRSTLMCITLSQRPWVEMSMKAFMPRLAQLWQECEISVHYAVEEYVATPSRQGFWCQKPSGAGGLEGTVLELHMRSNRKRKVMERVLRRFYRKNNNCWLHAVSVGDGLAERDALQEISMTHQNPAPESGEPRRFRVKTIQMIEDPSCEHIKMQLEVLKKWTQVIIHSDQDMDAVFGF